VDYITKNYFQLESVACVTDNIYILKPLIKLPKSMQHFNLNLLRPTFRHLYELFQNASDAILI